MKNNNNSLVEIWTDGGCANNPGMGGVGIVLKYQEHSKIINGFIPYTTNNQMELLAVIIALKSLKKSCNINLFTDSQYLKNGITSWISSWKNNNWKTSNKKPVKNQKLWQELDALIQGHKINFEWVKAHNGNPENELADSLCTKAILEQQPLLEEYLSLLDNSEK